MKNKFKEIVGFSLVELMAAMAIVGILAMVAYPSYTDSVRKSRRIDAINSLLMLQIEQEKIRTHKPTYESSISNLPVSMSGTPPAALSSEGYYTLAVNSATASTFKMTATPVSGSSQASDTCGSFVVTHNGPDFSSGADAACWNQ